jgi:hypothetical protein
MKIKIKKMNKDTKDFSTEKKYSEIINETRLEKDNLEDKNKLLKIILGIISVSAVIVLLIFLFNRDSDYEKGIKLLNNKNYSEALFEFQKVSSEDQEFRMAQSKINYINGIKALDIGNRSEALMLLVKVEKSDQYYRETQILIEKINSENKRVNLESLSQQINSIPDTVVIIEKVKESEAEKVNEAENKSTATKYNNPALVSLQNMISEFEYQYQAAENPGSLTRKENLRLMDSLYNYHINSDFSRKGDAAIIEINRTTESWMRMRIDLVSEIIKNNSRDESKTIVMIKEEGDKMYSKLLSLLKS